MLDVEDVKAGFRLILGRDPESDAVVAAHARGCESIADLRLALMGSAEFQADFRRNFAVNVPPPADLQAPPARSAPAPDPADVKFLQTCDPHDYVGMLAASSQTVRQYCARHGFDYEAYIGIKQGYFPWHACFNRIFQLKELWERGFRGWAVYLDADSIVIDQDFDLLDYLKDKAGFAAVLTHCAWGAWWNINTGVMMLNYSHPWTAWFIERYLAMFLEYSRPGLRQAADWGSVPHDQDLLQQILARSLLNRRYVFFEYDQSMNWSNHQPIDALPRRPFIQQVLRERGGFDQRLEAIATQVAAIVTEAPALWNAKLLTLLPPQGGRGWPARSAPETPGDARSECAAAPLPGMRVETEATTAQIAAMAARAAAREPRREEGEPTADQAGVGGLYRAAERCGVDLGKLDDCLALGSGLDGTAWRLSERFTQVTAADFSKADLERCRTALQRTGPDGVRFIHLGAPDAMRRITGFDLFFSTDALQHYPPPLIRFVLDAFLHKLRPGGVAYFRVPTSRDGYRFAVDEYLAGEAPERLGDMHLIPQPVLFGILQQCRCRILECREDGYAGDFSTIANTILAQKAASPIAGLQRALRIPFVASRRPGSRR